MRFVRSSWHSIWLAAAGVVLALAAPAAAQSDYPNRPVRLIIPSRQAAAMTWSAA